MEHWTVNNFQQKFKGKFLEQKKSSVFHSLSFIRKMHFTHLYENSFEKLAIKIINWLDFQTHLKLFSSLNVFLSLVPHLPSLQHFRWKLFILIKSSLKVNQKNNKYNWDDGGKSKLNKIFKIHVIKNHANIKLEILHQQHFHWHEFLGAKETNSGATKANSTSTTATSNFLLWIYSRSPTQ